MKHYLCNIKPGNAEKDLCVPNMLVREINSTREVSYGEVQVEIVDPRHDEPGRRFWAYRNELSEHQPCPMQ